VEYDKIRDKIKNRLETVNDPDEFVVVYDHVPDSLTPPCAIVVPSNNAITYHEAMGTVGNALILCRFDIVIASQRFNTDFSQEKLDEYLGTVPTALEGDQTLEGYAKSVTVTNARNYGPLTFGSEVYLGVQLDLEVLV
tara:strand:- start:288 stop:701 length:414 start_codon:yes stop_codon:yes gene_type:complete